jgi:FAD/FMN-containing dehydrogenase
LILKSFGGIEVSPEFESPKNQNFALAAIGHGQYLPIGNSRSYGDVGLISKGKAIDSKYLNKFIDFDEESGILTCEPGVLLKEIQELFVKRGWMLAVTPGTSLVTVAGAIANDVHGKDHHFSGTFGEHVISLTLARSTGEVFHCSQEENSGLFRATIGGLGLTGFILQARIRLKKVAGPYFDAEIIPFSSLGEFFEISKESEQANWQATVAWFDCSTSKAGRGSFTRGNASLKRGVDTYKEPRTISLPFTPPISLINKLTLNPLNLSYFHLQKRLAGKKVIHYKNFYYPLDGIRDWNRAYGPKGFFQYQSVIPMSVSHEATNEMLDVIRNSGEGSFLAVLKTFADRESAGMLSFPMHGATLALDFPNRGVSTLELFEKLDKIVSEAGGRLNPSKDARMSREMFHNGFSNLELFAKYRDTAISSDFSQRVLD